MSTAIEKYPFSVALTLTELAFTFELTATEAEKAFKITRPTFHNAIHALIDVGFLEVARHGGILDGKGMPALYRLSDRWKSGALRLVTMLTSIKLALLAKKPDGYG